MSAAAVLPQKGSKQDLSGNERFNAEAAEWDSNPGLHALSAEANQAIQKTIAGLSRPAEDINVLELGCGTGLLTLFVAPHVKSVTAVDAAYGMIEVLKAKLSKPNAPGNVTPVCELLEEPEDPALPPADLSRPAGPRMKYDLVISHLVLHHIPDLKGILTTLFGCLAEGGCIALTDFEDFGPEAHKFHSKKRMEGVARHGAHRESMKTMLGDVGFVDVRIDVAWTMNKKIEKWEGEFDAPNGRPREGQGVVMEFPFLLMYGRKPRRTRESL